MLQPHAHQLHRPRVIHLDFPRPPMGGKCWLLRDKGMFVLERGPGTLRTIACTHAGSGAIEAIDGVPDENGFFSDEELREPAAPAGYIERMLVGDVAKVDDSIYAEAMRKYCMRNGRPFYSAHPTVMGSWMLDAGFHHGLTIRAEGGHQAAHAIASIVWVAVQRKEPT